MVYSAIWLGQRDSKPWATSGRAGVRLKKSQSSPYCVHAISFRGEVMASSKEEQEKAEVRFHKTLKKAQEAKQAMSQYEADARAVSEKTAKLRALRLAKEAADAKEAAEKKPEIKKRSVKKSVKKAASPRPDGEI